MPKFTPAEHLDRARVHETFSDAVEPVDHKETPGWRITGLYYTALRRISAYLVANHGQEPLDHKETRRMMKEHPRTSGDVFVNYKILEGWSHSSRYSVGGLNDTHVLRAKDLVEKITAALA